MNLSRITCIFIRHIPLQGPRRRGESPEDPGVGWITAAHFLEFNPVSAPLSFPPLFSAIRNENSKEWDRKNLLRETNLRILISHLKRQMHGN